MNIEHTQVDRDKVESDISRIIEMKRFKKMGTEKLQRIFSNLTHTRHSITRVVLKRTFRSFEECIELLSEDCIPYLNPRPRELAFLIENHLIPTLINFSHLLGYRHRAKIEKTNPLEVIAHADWTMSSQFITTNILMLGTEMLFFRFRELKRRHLVFLLELHGDAVHPYFLHNYSLLKQDLKRIIARDKGITTTQLDTLANTTTGDLNDTK